MPKGQERGRWLLPSIIAAIVAIIAALIGLVPWLDQKFNSAQTAPPAPQTATPASSSIGAPAGMPTGIPVSASCPKPAVSLQTRQPVITGQISRPIAGGEVSQTEFDVGGTIGAIPAGFSVWTVTEIIGPDGHTFWDKFKAGSCRMWPGSAPVTISGQTWQARVSFGGADPAHVGLRFRLSLIIADETAAAQFVAYNKTASPGYVGLAHSDLTGVRELAAASIEVLRG